MKQLSPIILYSTPNDDNSDSAVIPSPSGINVLPAFQQQAIFFTAFATLSATTYLLRPIFHDVVPNLPIIGEYLWHPEAMGLIFVLAGVSHFFVEEYMDIYPPKGTWGGLWQLPGTPKFHVEWTGVAEVLGGLGLFLGRSGWALDSPELASASAAALLGLSVAVYPANLHMFTHGVELPKGVKMDNGGHYGRFVAQIVLCGVLAGLI